MLQFGYSGISLSFTKIARNRIILFFVIICNSLQAILQRIPPYYISYINMLECFYLFLCKIVGGWQKGRTIGKGQNGKNMALWCKEYKEIYIYILNICFYYIFRPEFFVNLAYKELQRNTKKYPLPVDSLSNG